MVCDEPVVVGGLIEERALHSGQRTNVGNGCRQSALQRHGKGLAPIVVQKATGADACDRFQVGSDRVAFGLRAAVLDDRETVDERCHVLVADKVACSRTTTGSAIYTVRPA